MASIFFLTGLHLFWRVSTSPAVCPGIIGFFFFFAKFIFATQWPLFVVDFQARLPGFTGFFFWVPTSLDLVFLCCTVEFVEFGRDFDLFFYRHLPDLTGF